MNIKLVIEKVPVVYLYHKMSMILVHYHNLEKQLFHRIKEISSFKLKLYRNDIGILDEGFKDWIEKIFFLD